MPHNVYSVALLLAMLTTMGLRSTEIVAAETATVSLADGRLEMTAPEGWEKVVPSVRIIEYEFKVPAVEGDKNDARVTIMGAGGSVDANVKRWLTQFSKTTKNDVTKETISDQEVHLIDVVGTYDDKRGPFAPGVKREGYRMLAAIIVTEKSGKYFVKFYGPEKTVGENEKAFRAMIDSLKVK